MSIKPVVLVIDDEPQIVQALVDLLEDTYQVVTAASGAEGLRRLQERSDIAVILCDQRMPKMSGDQFFTQARTMSAAVRVLITGYADLEAVMRAVNDGHIYSYLTKPVDIDRLRFAIDAAYKDYRAAAALLAERELLEGLMDNMPDQICFKDKNGRFLRINRTLADWLGFEDPQMAIDRQETYFVNGDHAFDIAEAERKIREEGAAVVHQVWVESEGTSDERWWSALTAPIRDGGGALKATVAVRRNISQERRLERDLEYQRLRRVELESINRRIQYAAGHDSLTGLPNRFLLEDRMRQLQVQSKRRGTSIALIYLDLDGFHAVNEAWGPEVADAVLKQVADLLMPCLRETDIAARLGEDEFAVVGEVDRAKPHADAKMLAERILAAVVGAAFSVSQIRLSCSIGVAVFPDDAGDFTSAMRLADRAMYEAKRRGKGVVVLSTEVMSPAE